MLPHEPPARRGQAVQQHSQFMPVRAYFRSGIRITPSLSIMHILFIPVLLTGEGAETGSRESQNYEKLHSYTCTPPCLLQLRSGNSLKHYINLGPNQPSRVIVETHRV